MVLESCIIGFGNFVYLGIEALRILRSVCKIKLGTYRQVFVIRRCIFEWKT